MMFTTNKIFPDSSIFIETPKKKHVPFFTFLTQVDNIECCVNEIVCSEVWYVSPGLFEAASLLAVKEKTAVAKVIINNKEIISFFRKKMFLVSELSTTTVAIRLMETYHLVPNGHRYLHLEHNNRKFLASHDKGCAA